MALKPVDNERQVNVFIYTREREREREIIDRNELGANNTFKPGYI